MHGNFPLEREGIYIYKGCVVRNDGDGVVSVSRGKGIEKELVVKNKLKHGERWGEIAKCLENYGVEFVLCGEGTG